MLPLPGPRVSPGPTAWCVPSTSARPAFLGELLPSAAWHPSSRSRPVTRVSVSMVCLVLWLAAALAVSPSPWTPAVS